MILCALIQMKIQLIVAIPMMLLKGVQRSWGYPPHLRFHDLRHSHATIAIQQLKMSARTVQLRLGHSSVTTTLGIYTAEFAAQDKEIGEAFDF